MSVRTANPEFKQTVTEKLERQFFMHLLAIQPTNVEEGKFSCKLAVEKKHLQHKGFVHGGVLATLADVAAGFASVTLVRKDQHVVTVELKVSYLNPAVSEMLLVDGWVIKQGRKLHFCEAEVYALENNQRKVLIKASATMAVLDSTDVVPLSESE